MKRINKNELLNINGGGLNLTGVLVKAFVEVGRFIYSVGQELGSSLRRISSNNMCPINR